jgi:hypothetical protein
VHSGPYGPGNFGGSVSLNTGRAWCNGNRFWYCRGWLNVFGPNLDFLEARNNDVYNGNAAACFGGGSASTRSVANNRLLPWSTRPAPELPARLP